MAAQWQPVAAAAPPELTSSHRPAAAATLKLLAASAAWLASSWGIIIANRWILVELAWPYPMAVAALGMAASGVFGFVACDLLRLAPPVAGMDLAFYATRVFPVGVLQALAMWLSNNLYLLLNVAFIEMCRALLPLFIMLALFAAGLETPTRGMVWAVSLTGVGCLLAAYGEVRLSVPGLLCLLGNFTLEAGRLVLMQVLLVGRELHALQGLKLVAPASVLCLGLMSLATEAPSMASAGALRTATLHWPVFAAAACMGLGVNLLSNVVIKMSGSTALKVLGSVRGPIVIMSGVLLFREQVAALELVGYSIALTGFTWYNYLKSQPAQAGAQHG